MTMKIEIRELREEDIEALADIERESFSMPWSENAFRDLLRQPYCRYLVALADSLVAGCCGYTNLCNEANIDNVVVAERFRRRGIARAMLEKLFALGEAEGVEAYTLEVRVSNVAAIHFYEQCGFCPEGIRPGFYDRPKEDALIMWKRKKMY
ncbi:ribosomal-protein-alanine N-acetyltransferase [Acetatifactor muris]|uniref:[Ribosomal protein bS18]-alanine N-acetyltransferase n=2 Tax=Acetatifactor muris TaxID=879566 RepID=A0A2K4ZMP6_9FIRM|nr:ribosomal-protein-alanine N-acetyltransferase [Acetatifactor muris]